MSWEWRNSRFFIVYAKALSCAASDMCYNLSGKLGRECEIALQNYLRQQKEFVEQMKPKPGKVKHIVNTLSEMMYQTLIVPVDKGRHYEVHIEDVVA